MSYLAIKCKTTIIMKFEVIFMFAYRLKQLREVYGLTQEELAKKLNLTQSTIAYYENNKKMPTLENAKQIAKIFNTSLDYLLDIPIDQVWKKGDQYVPNSNKFLKDINSLSPRSQEDLEIFIKFLKFRDSEER